MLDESIPLTTGEFEEWGNPQDPQYYEYMKSYSPYDNVTAQVYPHLLVTTGLHDSQVQYWEPAKWVAKLRELKTDDHLLLLCTDMDSGHGGKSGRFKSYEGVAMEYAFLVALAQGTLPKVKVVINDGRPVISAICSAVQPEVFIISISNAAVI